MYSKEGIRAAIKALKNWDFSTGLDIGSHWANSPLWACNENREKLEKTDLKNIQDP